ncbi:MAG: isoaspartyl peptidase/L-asparaginase [Armatimonadaceae bacterium]
MDNNENMQESKPKAHNMYHAEPMASVVLAVHGGAGRDIVRGKRGDSHDDACRNGLTNALRAGYAVLQRGGAALDAVEAAVRVLEDDPHFNAARGASLALNGKAELDASVMDGATGGAGAVAGITTVKNPVTLARAVMEKSSFVFLVAPGAEEFADTLDLERVSNDYFITPEREAQRQRLLAQGGGFTVTAAVPEDPQDQKLGTVGAVARDRSGNLAAATSTGGMAGKRHGRVGDSPLIAAGTWAENRTCAVSCTGHGEYFIRHAVAYDIAARMKYAGVSLGEASGETLHEVTQSGGDGGLIALDAQGNATLPFNTPGMYRGYITEDGSVYVSIYREEHLNQV